VWSPGRQLTSESSTLPACSRGPARSSERVACPPAGEKAAQVSDYLSDNQPARHWTGRDIDGLLTSVDHVSGAGRDQPAGAWESRGRRFKSCRPDGCDVSGHRAQVSRDILHGWAWGW
jgi:hypothetical protein